MLQPIDIHAEHALFEGQLQGLIAPIYENERPIKGLAGRLDWRFGGVISNAIRSGALSGQLGECAYVPAYRGGRAYHLILIGGGHLSRYAKRGLVPDAALSTLGKNLVTLKLPRLGLSRTDFGGLTEDYLDQHFKGAEIWIAP